MYFNATAAPPCNCTCKDGAFGDRCQYPSLYDHGPYVSEYRHVCTAPAGHVSRAAERCAALGSEWSLASFSSDASMAAFHTLMGLPLADTFVGATRAAATKYDGPWSFISGRLAGLSWWEGAEDGRQLSLPFSFANGSNYSGLLGLEPWALTEPQALAGEDCAIMGRVTAPARMLANVPCVQDSIFPSRPCSACERFPCQLGVDCVANNAESVTGYFPSCVCTCMPEFEGARCERRRVSLTVDHGPYTSQYIQYCPPEDFPFSAFEGFCGARPQLVPRVLLPRLHMCVRHSLQPVPRMERGLASAT